MGFDMIRKANFTVDLDSFHLVRGEVNTGRIIELSSSELSLIAPHIPKHSETIYAACSGVALAGQYEFFKAGETQLSIEWVRIELKPKRDEPECNTYRYLFGLTTDCICLSYDFTEP